MLCIEKGTIVSPKESFKGNLYIEGEKIRRIFRESEQKEETTFLESLQEEPERIDASLSGIYRLSHSL